MRKYEDLTGQTYGRLTAIKPYRNNKGRMMWECKCLCGTKTTSYASDLKSGRKRSCGCLKLENARSHKKHGISYHPLYKVFYGMINRCENKNNIAYERYGGRGIKICNEWRNNIFAFYEWAIKNGYKKGLSIDRIDNDGDYSPDNCRWATVRQQCNNKRKNINISLDGETHTAAEWSRILGIPKGTITSRANNPEWTDEEVLGGPHKRVTTNLRRSKTIAYKNGEMVGVFDSQRLAAEKLGVRASKISACVNGLRPHTCGYTFKRYEEVAT